HAHDTTKDEKGKPESVAGLGYRPREAKNSNTDTKAASSPLILSNVPLGCLIGITINEEFGTTAGDIPQDINVPMDGVTRRYHPARRDACTNPPEESTAGKLP
ncbi:hypothetical protein FOZ62_002300, partial [Perkinsus olseni]